MWNLWLLKFVAYVAERDPVLKLQTSLPAGLAALSLALGGQALAQTPVAPQLPQAVPTPVPTSEPATGSLEATSSVLATSSIQAATPSVAPTATTSVVATPSALPTAGGFPALSLPTSWPKLPFDLTFDYRMDGLGQGKLGFGGYSDVPTAAGSVSTNLPGIVAASPSIAMSGFSVGADASFLFLGVGARYQNYGVPGTAAASLITSTPPGATTTTFPTYPVFFPQSYNELYGRLLGIKLGLRNESYVDGSTYNDVVGGLNFGFGLFDVVSLNLGVLSGYALTKGGPAGSQGASANAANIGHIPAEGDLNVAVHVGPVRGRLGYKAAGVMDGDPGAIAAVFTNPASLLPGGGGTSANVSPALRATRFGLYTGPYMGIELLF